MKKDWIKALVDYRALTQDCVFSFKFTDKNDVDAFTYLDGGVEIWFDKEILQAHTVDNFVILKTDKEKIQRLFELFDFIYLQMSKEK